MAFLWRENLLLTIWLRNDQREAHKPRKKECVREKQRESERERGWGVLRVFNLRPAFLFYPLKWMSSQVNPHIYLWGPIIHRTNCDTHCCRHESAQRNNDIIHCNHFHERNHKTGWVSNGATHTVHIVSYYGRTVASIWKIIGRVEVLENTDVWFNVCLKVVFNLTLIDKITTDILINTQTLFLFIFLQLGLTEKERLILSSENCIQLYLEV